MALFLLALVALPHEMAPRAVFAAKEDSHIDWFALSPDGRFLYTSSYSEFLRVWDLATGKTQRPFQTPARNEFGQFPGLSADGKTLVTCFRVKEKGAQGGKLTRVTVWDVASREEKYRFNLPEQKGTFLPWDICVSPDAGKLVAYRSYRTMHLYDIPARKHLAEIELPPPTGSYCVAFSPDGKLLATGHNNGVVELWDGANGKSVATLAAHSGKILSLAFSPDGKTLASGGQDKTVYLWDVPTRKRKGDLNAPDLIGEYAVMAFSPNGKTLATAGRLPPSAEGRFVLWDLATRKPRDDFHLPPVSPGPWARMQFSPDGKTLATFDLLTGDHPGVQLWDVPEPKPRPRQ